MRWDALCYYFWVSLTNERITAAIPQTTTKMSLAVTSPGGELTSSSSDSGAECGNCYHAY